MAVQLKKYPGVAVKGGKLFFGGADAVKLAGKYGTPLYVIDEVTLRDRCRDYRESFEKRYEDVTVLLASKALTTLAVARIVSSEGLGLDVASLGEMYGGMKAGADPGKMMMHGNFKKESDLEQALKWGIGIVVIDSLFEAQTLDRVARRLKKKARALLRVTPGVEAHTHEMIQTGKLDTKFGESIEGGAALKLAGRIAKMKSIDFSGLHYHIGSQILDVEPFRVSVRRVVGLIAELRDVHGVQVRDLDVGGGYPVRYSSRQALPSPSKFAAAICGTLKKEMKAAGLPLPHLYLEPGRSVVGPAGMTLYEVGPIKDIPGVRRYASVDGGLSDNPRPALYDAEYEAVIAGRPESKKGIKKYRVCGRHCETDTLIKEIALPAPAPGDVMAVLSTGAYNASMSSNYNKFPRPAMVLVNKGKSELIMERETIKDLYRKDVIPKRLAGPGKGKK